ncbi:uncharacterized protein LOC128396403 [Panonychus citri]|uniref:uncharacterized protein LOC128396403 n=1 Tax=Panonychus citri TaxID=50023 RepID=UPI0023074A0A|nr:uncharacterized protein LOC128396403 [Panonychus citri]
MKFILISIVLLQFNFHFGLTIPDAFDFGLLGPEAANVFSESCKKGLAINKQARNTIMSQCIYPTIRESTINFPGDFIGTLERIEYDCWNRRDDFCLRTERIRANHCAIPIFTSKGIRYHLFWQSNRIQIRSAFNEKKECIIEAIEEANE